MLVLNCSPLNREYMLINVLKTFALIISMCNLYVTFLLKITNGMFYPLSVRWDSGSQ
jgi:hypothetical protein